MKKLLCLNLGSYLLKKMEMGFERKVVSTSARWKV